MPEDGAWPCWGPEARGGAGAGWAGSDWPPSPWPPCWTAVWPGLPWGERERETFFLFRLCEQATYIIRAQDTVTALLQVQTIEGVGQLGGLNEL